MNNQNQNNNESKSELVDASLLNPFQSMSNNVNNEFTENVVETPNNISDNNVSNESILQKINSNPSENHEIVNNSNVNGVSESVESVNPNSNVVNNYEVPNTQNIPNSNIQVQNNPTNTIEVDDELLNCYIGPNADVIKRQGISWPTFFFGLYYTLYRKMWMLSFILFAISFIAAMFLPSLYNIISFGLGIAIFVMFNKLYVNHAKEEIKKIIAQNPNATREELKSKCQRQGGTSIAVLIIYILIFLALQFYVNSNSRSTSYYQGINSNEKIVIVDNNIGD